MENGLPIFSHDANYSAAYVSCSPGDIFTINGDGGEICRLYSFIQSDGTILEKAGGSKNFTNLVITAPENSAFLLVQTKDERPSYIGEIIDSKNTTLTAKVNSLDSNLNGFKSLTVNGYYTQQTETGWAIQNNKAVGSIVDIDNPVQSEGLASIIIPGISAGMKFLVFGSSTYNYLYWSFLDKDKKLLTKAGKWSSSGPTGTILIAPENAIYLVCSSNTNYQYGFNVQCLTSMNYIADRIINDTDIINANFKKNSTFSFVFFSDVHGGNINVEHIINYAEEHNINTIINGGDTILRYLDDPQESFDWYANLISTSHVDILSAVGNHDVWKGAYWTKGPSTEIYNTIIKPITDNFTNIIQPTSAESEGLCYFYKDYDNIRVIVINAMSGSESVKFWDQNQATWFENVLNDAYTNNKHVIVCTHAPYAKNIAQRDEKSNWNSWIDYRTWSSSDAIIIETEPLDIIKNFITQGGKFICLLTGHEHCDNILWATGYENLLMVNIASARYTNHSDGIYYSDENSDYYDCFNHCEVDTTNGIFKIMRIGWNMDASTKKRTTFTYNYFTHTIIKD